MAATWDHKSPGEVIHSAVPTRGVHYADMSSRGDSCTSGNFWAFVFIYIQALAIVALALALWMSSQSISNEMELIRSAADRNNTLISEMRQAIADQSLAQERWQAQAIATIRKAMEAGEW